LIEIGIFHNGGTDLPAKRLPSGTMVPDGSLAEIHESFRRVAVSKVRQGILADELGFDGFYLTEHHFQLEGAEFSPNPLFTQMAIASRTKRIRLGQSVNIITQHHPIRLAEQIAELDVVSGGRVDCGIGRGYQTREVEVFSGPFGGSMQDQERNRAFFEECYEILLKAWGEVSFSHHGEFFTIPPTFTKWNHRQTIAYFGEQEVERSLEDVLKLGAPDDYGQGANVVEKTTTVLKQLSVFPQVQQQPHPPLWMPAFSSRTADWTAANGINCFALTAPNSRIKALADRYRDVAERNEWPDRLQPGMPLKYGWDGERRRGVSIVKYVHVLDPALGTEDGLQRAKDSLEATWDFYGSFGFEVTLSDVGEPPFEMGLKVTGDLLMEKNVAFVGTKDEVIAGILRIREDLGPDAEDLHLLAWFEFAGYTSDEIEAQMQFFAEEIAPVVRREYGGGVDFPDSDVDLDVGRKAVA